MRRSIFILLALLAPCAGEAVGGITAAAIDCGGQRIVGGNYTIDGSIGGIGGITSNASAVSTLKAGYLGQLTEVTNLAIVASPASVNEGGGSQLGGVARLDDGTLTLLTGTDVVWSAPVYPIGSISAGGVATALTVYADTPASGSGSYLGVTGSWAFLVLNSNPDNYGLYAGDQIPDAWQIRYFGTTNPLGQAGATNAGRNNLYSYIADLDPTNPASVFGIVAVSNLPPNRVVYFLPASTARVYALQYGTNLMSGSWSNVTLMTNWGNGGVFWLSDTNAMSPRFYRVGVQVP